MFKLKAHLLLHHLLLLFFIFYATELLRSYDLFYLKAVSAVDLAVRQIAGLY